MPAPDFSSVEEVKMETSCFATPVRPYLQYQKSSLPERGMVVLDSDSRELLVTGLDEVEGVRGDDRRS